MDSQVYHKSTVSGVPCVSSGELISGCDPPGREDSRKNRLATGSLLTVWWKMLSLGLRLQQLLAFPLAVACLPLCLWGLERGLYAAG